MKPCYICNKEDKVNNHRLDPLLLPITYESSKIITSFDLPRKYTSTHNDQTKEIYLSIGHEYNKRLLESDEAVKVQSEVVGKWVKTKKGKYQINLTVLVSTEKNPQAEFRNIVFCRELGPVLEGIALAESALLKLYPRLASTKIYVHFKSIDPNYNRVEYWHRLGYWIN
jgi:hypothetical protein